MFLLSVGPSGIGDGMWRKKVPYIPVVWSELRS